MKTENTSRTVFVMLRVCYYILFVCFALCTPWSALKAAEQPDVSTAPTTNNGGKWRIGYIEGGPYQDYQSTLKAFILHLTELGWIEKTPFPHTHDAQETQRIWSWLVDEIHSDVLEFVADAYWSAEWDKELRQKNQEDVISRLNRKKDIDLILAFGTWAGLDMANNRHAIPTMVFSSSDPIRAGIVKRADDSGYDHLHARLDPTRFKRQVRLFHRIVGFTTLGMAFEDSPTGRTYAAIDDVQKVAEELGFDILECYAPDQIPDVREIEKGLVECYRELAPQADAFYMTSHTGLSLESLPKLLAPLFDHHVATFAQARTGEVKYGVLMSLAKQNFQYVGRFYAETFARILNGAKPRDLPQVFEDLQEIAVNLETARKIGFRFPLDILAGAKEIYEHIESPEE